MWGALCTLHLYLVSESCIWAAICTLYPVSRIRIPYMRDTDTGIRDAQFAPPSPLLQVRDTDTENRMQSWPYTHFHIKMQDADARYRIQSLPHTCQ